MFYSLSRSQLATVKMAIIDVEKLDESHHVSSQKRLVAQRGASSRANPHFRGRVNANGSASNPVGNMDCFVVSAFTVAWDEAARDPMNLQIKEDPRTGGNNKMYKINESPDNHDTRRVVSVFPKEESEEARCQIREIMKRNTMLYFGLEGVSVGDKVKVKPCKAYFGEKESEECINLDDERWCRKTLREKGNEILYHDRTKYAVVKRRDLKMIVSCGSMARVRGDLVVCNCEFERIKETLKQQVLRKESQRALRRMITGRVVYRDKKTIMNGAVAIVLAIGSLLFLVLYVTNIERSIPVTLTISGLVTCLGYLKVVSDGDFKSMIDTLLMQEEGKYAGCYLNWAYGRKAKAYSSDKVSSNIPGTYLVSDEEAEQEILNLVSTVTKSSRITEKLRSEQACLVGDCKGSKITWDILMNTERVSRIGYSLYEGAIMVPTVRGMILYEAHSTSTYCCHTEHEEVREDGLYCKAGPHEFIAGVEIGTACEGERNEVASYPR